MTEVFIIAAMVGAVLFMLASIARVKTKVLSERLSNLDQPPPIASRKSPKDTYKTVKAEVKRFNLTGRGWSIKEDNPKGMLMAVCSFEEGAGAQPGLLKRQIIMTAQVSATEGGGAKATVFYNVYSPVNRIACDEIVLETTKAIQAALSGESSAD